MGLRCTLFKGDAKLEACLVNDAAHVVPGAVGRHVAKIQIALITLDEADIPDSELTLERYGPATTAAVLAFKKKRGIINYSYQTQADNIVGKMTIARLDEEMLAREHPHQTWAPTCGDPIRTWGPPTGPVQPVGMLAALAHSSGGVRAAYSPATHSFSSGGPSTVVLEGDDPGWSLAGGRPVAERAPQKTQYGRDLHILLARTKLVSIADVDAQAGQLHHANDLLRAFGMELHPHSELTKPVDHSTIVVPGWREQRMEVRHAAREYDPEFPHALRVIYTRFPLASIDFGSTEPGGTYQVRKKVYHYRAFVLINVNKVRPDQTTLLHEMIHGAGLERHDPDESMPESIFSQYCHRTVLRDVHAEALAEAFFARSR